MIISSTIVIDPLNIVDQMCHGWQVARLHSLTLSVHPTSQLLEDCVFLGILVLRCRSNCVVTNQKKAGVFYIKLIILLSLALLRCAGHSPSHRGGTQLYTHCPSASCHLQAPDDIHWRTVRNEAVLLLTFSLVIFEILWLRFNLDLFFKTVIITIWPECRKQLGMRMFSFRSVLKKDELTW